MKSYLNAVRAVIWKDLTAEWRTRENLTAENALAFLQVGPGQRKLAPESFLGQ